MPVRDEDRLRLERISNLIDRLAIGHRPEAVFHSEMVGRFQRRQADDRLFQNRLSLRLWVRVQAEDRREVHLRRFGQQQPISFRAGECLLVRIDAALAKFFQTTAAHESLPTIASSLPRELLVIDVNRVVSLAQPDSFGLPLPHEMSGSRVLVVRRRVPRFLAIEVDANDVAGMFLVESGSKVLVDHVIRRSDHVRKITHLSQVIPPRTKGKNVYHADCFPD